MIGARKYFDIHIKGEPNLLILVANEWLGCLKKHCQRYCKKWF